MDDGVPLPGSSAMPVMDYSGAPLTLMVPDINSPEFDYGAYLLQESQDIDYLAEESSASTAALSGPTPQGTTLASDSERELGGSLASPSGTASSQTLTRRGRAHGSPGTSSGGAGGTSSTATTTTRQRLERRGHTKSRMGCFNCKRRRIKCQETRPACGHCVKTGLKCEYPTLPVVVHQPQHQIPLFSLQDMRFFQHFLFQCYPNHPIGAERLWTHEIPCLSEKYEFLMHAILGYSASQLMVGDPSLVEPAMAHRLKAIRAVKKALGEAPKTDTFEEGNALMATCYALTFQSVMLDDGMAEYMTFIRGILIVAFQMYVKGARLLFGEFMGDAPVDALNVHMEKVAPLERSWIDSAVASIKALRALCSFRDTETQYLDKMLEMAEACYTSAVEGYAALRRHYGWWMMLPHDEFQRIIDPSNQVAVLLGTHWIALKQIMVTITETELKGRAMEPDKASRKVVEHDTAFGIVKWLRYLNRLVDADHAKYNRWPMWVEGVLERDPRYFGRTIFC